MGLFGKKFVVAILNFILLLGEESSCNLVNRNGGKSKVFKVNVLDDEAWGDEDMSSFKTTEGSLPVTSVANKTYVPLVYWHGMGDTGLNVEHALRFIPRQLPGVYVKSIQIGKNFAEDMKNGYFLNVNDQVQLVCDELRNDTNLQKGYNAVGLSQGCQFLRAVAQRCPDPPMINLVSLGGQHQGVFGLPKCSAPDQKWCEIMDKLVTYAAYEPYVQKFLVQAEYWHDPFKQKEYVANSAFLADINNERVRNETYKQNLLKLRNFVMVLFEDESIVQPKESEWFGFFKPGSDKEMIKLQDSALYQEDWLGLKQMDEQGKLHFLSSPGDHLQFTEKWFNTNILNPFLNITL